MRLIDAEHMGSDNDINEKEVIDAMSYCFAVGDCERCAYRDKPCVDLMGDGLLIIKRLKAEIERLKNMIAQNEGVLPEYERLIKAEAIKEFAERLKQTRVDLDGIEMVAVGNIDAIIEQMTEE